MIYITGSSGFLGKHLLASLESEKIDFKTVSFTNIVKNKKFTRGEAEGSSRINNRVT
jgi:nucleoside-diphosphate-sugar epimerase